MAVDRNLKQKRKREEARKKIAQERERISQREKIDDYRYRLSSGVAGMQSWENVLRYAQKGLKLAPLDRSFFDYACHAASKSKDDVTLVESVDSGMASKPDHPSENALILAELIFQHQSKDVELLQEVLTAILHDRDRFVSRLKVKDRKRAEYLLSMVQQMIRNKQVLSNIIPDSKKPQTTLLKTGDIQDPVQTAVDFNDKSAEEAPQEPLPNPHVRFEIDTADFLNVIDSGMSAIFKP